MMVPVDWAVPTLSMKPETNTLRLGLRVFWCDFPIECVLLPDRLLQPADLVFRQTLSPAHACRNRHLYLVLRVWFCVEIGSAGMVHRSFCISWHVSPRPRARYIPKGMLAFRKLQLVAVYVTPHAASGSLCRQRICLHFLTEISLCYVP